MSTLYHTLLKMKSTFIKGILLFAAIILIHLPFLEADPDYNISSSRGPFSDEGLYSEQIRNYINHHYFKFHQSDALLKTPLFSAILFIPYLLLGTHLWVGRCMVMLISSLILFYCHRKFRIPYLIPVFFLCTMMQYYIFHHTHFALAEMVSCSFLLLSICLYNSFMLEDSLRKKAWKIFLSVSFLSLAWYTKIQFIYLAALIPLAYGAYLIFKIKSSGKQELLFLAFILLASFAYAIMYYLCWILPNIEFINYLLPLQPGQFKIDVNTPLVIKDNILNIFLSKEVLIFTIAFSISVLAGIYFLIRPAEKWFTVMFICSLTFAGLESHKLSMGYLPSRYLISTYFSMGLLISLVIVYTFSKFRRAKLLIPSAVIIILGVFHASNYFRALQNRHYVIRDINAYLAEYNFGKRPVLGPWAASCNWESGAITVPVWYNALNYKDPVGTYKPAMIISEADEMESGYAYKNQKIDLVTISDSVKTFQLAAWQIHLYWMRK
jgi:hypothetical protein